MHRLKDATNYQELAQAVIDLANSPEKRKEMSKNVLRIASGLLNWQERIDFEFDELVKLRAGDG